jgi:hypothetical protein
MATTIKGERGKTTIGAKTRSTSKIKSSGRGQTKIGKPAGKPKKKVKTSAEKVPSKGKTLKRVAGLAPSGGGHVQIWPPTIVSALGTSARTILLNWTFDLSSKRFRFKRKNLNTLTTTEFQIGFPSIAHDYSWNDNGGGTPLDPGTSYEYQVSAYHSELYMYGPWSDPVTGATINASFEPTFESTLPYDEEGWEGWCLVQRIEPHGLSKSGTQVQLTLRSSSASSNGAFIERVYISQPGSGGPYAPAEDLTEVSPKVDIPPGEALTVG